MKKLVAVAFTVLFVGGHASAQTKFIESVCKKYDWVPYNEAIGLSEWPETDQELRKMTRDLVKQNCWSNALVMLAIRSSKDDAKFFIDRLHAGTGPISETEWEAKSVIPLALGFLANRGSTAALMELEFMVDHRVETKNPFTWRSAAFEEDHQLNLYMARSAIEGLGLAGRQDVAKFLAAKGNDRAFIGVRDAIVTASGKNAQVEKEGLASIYPPPELNLSGRPRRRRQ